MLVQRLGTKSQKDVKYIEELISIFKRNKGCCDEVWLTTEYGYPKVETSKEIANQLLSTAKLFRDNGIKVSLQVANTLGHGDYISSNDCSGLVYDGSLVGNMVDISGSKSNYAFCYNNQFFRDYIKDTLLAYKDLKPSKLWIDDDLRIFHHGPSITIGCFCDDCISKFNKKHNFNYTREDVERLFYAEENIRKLYFSFMAESISEFVTYVLTPFHDACPDTIFGLQYGDLKTALTVDNKAILLAMKNVSGKNPQTRPSTGIYNDYTPTFLLRGCIHVNFLNNLLPDFVEETMPEIENLPDVVYGKSPAGTVMSATLNFAGASSYDMTYAMLMCDYEPLEYHETILKEFTRLRPYWENLVEINKRTVQSGVNYIFAKDTIRQTKEHPFNVATDFHVGVYDDVIDFMRVGIPLAYDGKKKGGVNLITKHNAPFLSDEQIKFLLTQPVICDAKVLMEINKRFNAFDVDYEVVDAATASKLKCKNTSHVANGDAINKSYPKSFYDPTLYRSLNYHTSNNVEVLSYYVSEAKNIEKACDGEYPYGVIDMIVTNKYGGKWIVCGTDLLNPAISYDRRNQFISAIEYICPNAIKVKINTKVQAMLMPREDENGNICSVSILNMSLGESGEITLNIKQPIGCRFSFIGQNSPKINLECKKQNDVYVLTLPSIAAWTVGTLFIE